MIANQDPNNQLPRDLKVAFKELDILKHLRKAGIKKAFGLTCSYLFQLIFCLIFEQKNWFRLLEGKKSNKFPAKDAVYRFLNFLLFFRVSFSLGLIKTADKPIKPNTIKAVL